MALEPYTSFDGAGGRGDAPRRPLGRRATRSWSPPTGSPATTGRGRRWPGRSAPTSPWSRPTCGAGAARADLPGPFGMRAHADDLVAVLDHLELDRAVLAGHSMGAYVATVAATTRPEALVVGGARRRRRGPPAARRRRPRRHARRRARPGPGPPRDDVRGPRRLPRLLARAPGPRGAGRVERGHRGLARPRPRGRGARAALVGLARGGALRRHASCSSTARCARPCFELTQPTVLLRAPRGPAQPGAAAAPRRAASTRCGPAGRSASRCSWRTRTTTRSCSPPAAPSAVARHLARRLPTARAAGLSRRPSGGGRQKPTRSAGRAADAGDQRDHEPGDADQVVVDVEGVVERPLARAEDGDGEAGERSSVITYSQPSPGRKMKKPLPRWLVMSATSIVPTTADAASGREQAEHEQRAAADLGQAGEPGVEDARLHAEALEPAARAGDLAAAEDVVDAVGQHHRADAAAQHEQGEVDRVEVAVAHAGRPYRRPLDYASAAMPKARTVAKVLGVVTAARPGRSPCRRPASARRGGRAGRARSTPPAAAPATRRWPASARRPAAPTRCTGPGGRSRRPSARPSSTPQFELQTAEPIAEALGNMKGALMKLGQMASYLDQGMPEPVREALAELQPNAPPMSAELAAEVVARGARRAARGGVRRVGPACRSRRRRSARCTGPSPTTAGPSR